MRLRRSSPDEPGIGRRRRGRGFSFVGPDGSPVTDEDDLARIRSLGIPPAWKDVWICAAPNGHLQAVGTDAAGRLQYVYHPDWTAKRDVAKFARMVRFAEALPAARRRAAAHLRDAEPTRRRALAVAFRIMDTALVRTGSEQYAKSSGSRGLATMPRRAATVEGSEVRLVFRGKAGVEHDLHIVDQALARAVEDLVRREGRSGGRLLAYREGPSWCAVRSDDINAYVKDVVGEEFTAKDFRTWHATVAAAEVVMSAERPTTRRAAAALARAAAERAAERLGNTPSVARRSYIDPRVFTLEPRPEVRSAGRRSREAVVLEALDRVAG